jgi:hypothetical protein
VGRIGVEARGLQPPTLAQPEQPASRTILVPEAVANFVEHHRKVAIALDQPASKVDDYRLG